MKIDGSSVPVAWRIAEQRHSTVGLADWRKVAERQWREQEKILRDLATPAGLQQVAEHRITVRDLLQMSPYSGLGLQKRVLARLLDQPRLLAALGGFSDVPLIMIEQAERYLVDLRSEASAENAATGESEDDQLRRLAAERDAILICLKRVGQAALIAEGLGVRLPPLVLGLILVFVVLGEVAEEVLQEREARAGDET